MQQDKPKVVGRHISHLAMKYGGIAGISLVGYFLLLQVFPNMSAQTGMILRYMKFIILAAVLYYAIRHYKFDYADSFKFSRGMAVGIGICMVAALIVALAEIIYYMTGLPGTFEPWFDSEESWQVGLLLSVFEITLIGGLIISLGWMLYLQRNVNKDVNREG